MANRSRPIGSSFALAAALARTGLTVLRATAPGGRERWERGNHAGRAVDLHAGPACAVAAAVGTARVRPAAGFAVLAAGARGAYDDAVGAGDPRRGFRARLSALRHGEVTSGAVKLSGLAAGAVLKERPLDKVLAGVVAGAAHFVNLVDVRPGPAGASVLALGAPGLPRKGPGAEAAAAVGAAAAVLPDDLAERTMLGDTGAHALGAALGVAVVAGNGRAAHAAALVAAASCGERASEAAHSLV
ncbi:hypothetical protein [Streptomyces sp. WG7]|uniref:hypothetical protein n=1 Tax=Streptomyces sp. WG7 TaxID=3417650 RepID=UPI003CEDCBD8